MFLKVSINAFNTFTICKRCLLLKFVFYRGSILQSSFATFIYMNSFRNLLKGNDLRSIGKSNSIALLITDQKQFDELFKNLFADDRIIVMRAADAIEKITVAKPYYLQPHKVEVLDLMEHAGNKELQWHLALMAPRMEWSSDELSNLLSILKNWLTDKTMSKIVRVNCIQALFDLWKQNQLPREEFEHLVSEIQKENIPSLNARIKKLVG